MTYNELQSVLELINNEIDLYHNLDSAQIELVEITIKNICAEIFGEENIVWNSNNCSYTRDWELYSLYTEMGIIVDDTQTDYEVSANVIIEGSTPEVVYLRVGDEVIEDNTDSINDRKIRRALSVKENRGKP